MSSNKDKVMKTLIEENLKLRNRIVQLERELEIMQSRHVDVLHELLECKLSIREILDIKKKKKKTIRCFAMQTNVVRLVSDS